MQNNIIMEFINDNFNSKSKNETSTQFKKMNNKYKELSKEIKDIQKKEILLLKL